MFPFYTPWGYRSGTLVENELTHQRANELALNVEKTQPIFENGFTGI